MPGCWDSVFVVVVVCVAKDDVNVFEILELFNCGHDEGVGVVTRCGNMRLASHNNRATCGGVLRLSVFIIIAAFVQELGDKVVKSWDDNAVSTGGSGCFCGADNVLLLLMTAAASVFTDDGGGVIWTPVSCGRGGGVSTAGSGQASRTTAAVVVSTVTAATSVVATSR